MQALQFWKAVALDEANMLEGLVGLFDEHGVAYCVIGGQAVNAYVEPLVSMDLDVVVAVRDLERIRPLLQDRFRVEVFQHSIDLSLEGSGLGAQIRTDPRYTTFLERAERRDVLGLTLPVASLDDVLQGKVWAVTDRTRRASKRQKDLADIARILEASPDLRSLVPDEVLGRLMS
jgi:hypothetical protein